VLLTSEEVAGVLGVHPNTVDRERADGRLVGTLIRGRVMYTLDAVWRYVEQQQEDRKDDGVL
jgi:hypothetical protein